MIRRPSGGLPSRVSNAELDRVVRFFKPWRRLSSPKCVGLDNVPQSGPLLFVGNHTLYGILDAPMMVLELYLKKGLFLRSLGDHAHFRIPVWRSFLSKYGVVDGTRENCARLMEAGEPILVFPGGAREVAKRKGEKYQLMWKERVGFVRMALRHGCPIVPFAAVGAEEAWDIVVDADQILASPVGGLLRRLGIREEAVPPLVRGVGPTPLPRPERLYFYFGRPIETQHLIDSADDQAVCLAVRAQVQQEVEHGIAHLLALQDRDPKRDLWVRMMAQLLPKPHPPGPFVGAKK